MLVLLSASSDIGVLLREDADYAGSNLVVNDGHPKKIDECEESKGGEGSGRMAITGPNGGRAGRQVAVGSGSDNITYFVERSR